MSRNIMQSVRSYSFIERLLWAVAMLTMPVTSFRYFPGMGEGTFVRPLAFYPIGLLMVVIAIRLWRRKESLPRSGVWIPLSALVLFMLAASSFGALLDPLPLRGQDYFGRTIRAWVTILIGLSFFITAVMKNDSPIRIVTHARIGLSFFITAVWMNRSEDDLRFTLKWLFAGFVIDVCWSGVQSLAFYSPLLEKETVTLWQRAFSMRELVRTNRVSGMAYEPAWLAGQITMIYMPWLFAALLTRVRTTRFKWYEIVLFGFAMLLLLATYSRGGLLTGIIALVLTLLFVGRAEMKTAWRWFVNRGMWLRLAVVIMILGGLTGAGLFLSRKGYITRLFNSNATSIEDFIIQNSAGARAAYSFGALGAYDKSPWFGVGVGASGFYIYDHLPDWAMTTVPEIAKQLSPDSRLYPNPKNMYARLLAETGLIGFFLFLAFQFYVLGDVLAVLQKQEMWLRFVGVAGLFSWIAIMLTNATQDSFAIPNIWLNFGVIAGLCAYGLESEKNLHARDASSDVAGVGIGD